MSVDDYEGNKVVTLHFIKTKKAKADYVSTPFSISDTWCVQVGDESYMSYTAERDAILSSLARRAKVSFWVHS